MADARDATESEAGDRLSAQQGINLGRYYFHESDKIGNELIYDDERHVVVFGPTGSGKTTRLLMVNLLSDCLTDRSVIVVDPKGELAAVCAKERHRIGHDVKILDPFGKLREVIGDLLEHRDLVKYNLIESAGFDPIATLDPGTDKNRNPNFYDDAAAIGEALIKIEGNDPHWPESAQGLITGLVMWEAARPKEAGEVASLDNVRRMLTEADQWAPAVDDDGRPVLGSRWQAGGRRQILRAGCDGAEDGEGRRLCNSEPGRPLCPNEPRAGEHSINGRYTNPLALIGTHTRRLAKATGY